MSDLQPRITVVTPSYNQGRFIGDAVESVLGQGWSDVEHIIVDAQSTDETSRVLARYPHLHVIMEADLGQSDGLNKGFLAARGPFVCWLNADDYLLPGAFARFTEAFEQQPDGVVFFGHYYMVDESRRFIRSRRFPPFDRGVCRHYAVTAPTSGSFFATRLFRELGLLLDVDLHVLMDWDLYQRLAQERLLVVQIPEFVSAFRCHSENKSIIIRYEREEQRRAAEDRRAEERRRVIDRYCLRCPSSKHLERLLRVAAVCLHRGRYIVRKGVSLHYVLNALDRLRPPDVRPAGTRREHQRIPWTS